MGNLGGSIRTKANLEIGSKVVYTKKTAYKGFSNSPENQDRLTVKGIFTKHIKLEETPDINYDIDDFFDYFVQIGD